jgi:hypothetical protein
MPDCINYEAEIESRSSLGSQSGPDFIKNMSQTRPGAGFMSLIGAWPGSGISSKQSTYDDAGMNAA